MFGSMRVEATLSENQVSCKQLTSTTVPDTQDQQGECPPPTPLLLVLEDRADQTCLSRRPSPTPNKVCVCVCSDYVSVPVKILVNNIEVTSGEYHFYNCAATVRKNPNMP